MSACAQVQNLVDRGLADSRVKRNGVRQLLLLIIPREAKRIIQTMHWALVSSIR